MRLPSLTVEAPEGFEPGCSALPSHADDRCLWLLMRDGDVVFAALPDGAHGFISDPSGHGLTPRNAHALGTLHGVRVCAAEFDGAVPGELKSLHLRAALMSLPPAAAAMVAYGSQVVHWDRTTRFCGECGHRTERHADPSRRAKRCPSCAHEWYPRVSPCTITLVYDHDGRVLLTRQSAWPAGRYGLVAGFVESAESLEQCVRREAREETGVELADIAYAGSQPWPFPHQLMVGFTARHVSGEASPRDGELEEARWFTREALPVLPPRFSIARQLIEAFFAARFSESRPGG